MFIRGLLFALASLASPALLVACSGDDTNPAQAADGGPDATSGDSGADTGATGDAGSHDAGADTGAADGDADVQVEPWEGGDAAASGDAEPDVGDVDAHVEPSDGGDAAASGDTGPTGTLLAPGNDLNLIGVTSDNYVVYERVGTIYTVPVTGGVPQPIFPGSSARTFIAGPAVYVVHPFTPGTTPCVSSNPTWPSALTLVAWTSAYGTVPISPCAILDQNASVSADGSLIAYEAWEGPSFDDVGINVTRLDGTATVATAAPCGFDLRKTPIATTFGPNGVLLATVTCGEDGGPQSESHLFAPSTFSLVASFQGAGTLDPTGAWLWLRLAHGGQELVRTADGSVAASDPDPSGGPAAFDASGQYLYYEANGALKQLALSAAPTVTVLAPGGALDAIAGVTAVNANGGFVLDLEGPSGGGPSALGWRLRSTSTGDAASVILDELDTTGTPTFTLDGEYLLQQSSVGILSSFPTTTPSPVDIAGGVISGYLTLRGAKVATLMSGNGAGLFVDASGHSARSVFTPTVTAAQVALDGAAVVYTTTSLPCGLYVVATP
jgi:hypothetical protein